MTAPFSSAETAFRVADRVRRAPGPWDVYGEAIRRFEIHINGDQVEMTRGPIQLEGYGYRVIAPHNGGVRVGFAGSTDVSTAGVARTIEEATIASRFSSFPAKDVSLPGSLPSSGTVLSADPELWARPEASIERFVSEVLAPFDGRKDVRPSFGSLRVALIDVTFANSSGAKASFQRTSAELEFAVRSTAGPEGPGSGEYWVNQRSCCLDHRAIASQGLEWSRKARDAGSASPTPPGVRQVLLPPEVLSEILPATLGFRLGGQAALRGMMPPKGSAVGGANIDLWDDGLYPYGLASAPWDDEGVLHAKRPLIQSGEFREPIYDVLHGRALSDQSTGGGRRDTATLSPWFHFMIRPNPGPSTMVLGPGDGGSDQEMIEALGEGLWVDQLGYSFPDPVSGAFGGEIRLGYLVKDGKLSTPVRGGTVGGVALAAPGEPSLLRSVSAVGGRPTLVGQLSAPALSVGSLSVAGA
ncbi:MAG: TldD/PmbA family protein [Thermoplasmata archaeon]|nr:TldD/PmbA family protein [Thermoplasmata archaeon]MCI4358840.1 TldD/PmbA family protein [Thermoplasmata archaeon]